MERTFYIRRQNTNNDWEVIIGVSLKKAIYKYVENYIEEFPGTLNVNQNLEVLDKTKNKVYNYVIEAKVILNCKQTLMSERPRNEQDTVDENQSPIGYF